MSASAAVAENIPVTPKDSQPRLAPDKHRYTNVTVNCWDVMQALPLIQGLFFPTPVTGIHVRSPGFRHSEILIDQNFRTG